MAVLLASKLDRTVLQLPISKHTLLNALTPFNSFCGSYLTKPDQVSTKHKLHVSASFLDDAVAIELWSLYGKHRFVRYRILPAWLNAAAFETFIDKTAMLGPIGYTNVVTHGFVRELEIAVDYVGKHTKDYLFYRPGVHSGEHVKGNHQAAGTYYQGALTSDLQTCAYNKAEQLKDIGLSCPFDKLMRIEAKFRHSEVKASELAAIPNPFSKLLVCSMPDLHKVSHPEPVIWQSFLARSTAFGVSNALAAVPHKYKQQIRTILKQHCAPWWNPETLMKGFAQRAAEQLRLDLCD